MTKNILAQVALLSMVVCSVTQLAFSQQPAADDLFGSGDPFDLPSSPVAPGSGGYPIGESSTQSNARASKEFSLEGVVQTASRVQSFTVNASTLQIQSAGQSGMGGMGAAGGMMGSMDGGDGMAGGYGNEMGAMGGGMGAMGGGMGGMGMGMGGSGMGSRMDNMQDVRVVVAFVLDDEQIAGRTRIEVLAPHGPRGNYIRLEALSAARPAKVKTEKKAPPLWSPATAKLIKDTISLKIWKEDAIKTLKAEEGTGERAAASEKLLKAVLSEEYDTQLARQQFELARLQERLKRIQDEFTRRQQAKDRVIDVQIGKIILEAQGILGDNQ